MADDPTPPHGNGFTNRSIKVSGLDEAVNQIRALSGELKGLQTALTNFTPQLTNSLTKAFSQITSGANTASTAVQGVGSAVQSTVQSTRSGSGVLGSLFGAASAAAGSDIVKDLAMFPLRYTTSTIGNNRQLGMNVSSALAGQMYATGATPVQMMRELSRFPGNVLGAPEDLLNLMGIARQSGAYMDLNRTSGAGAGMVAGGANQYSARTVGFLQAVSEAQKITPATPVAQIAGTIGGYSASTQAQQTGAMLTGGAYSMIAAGGRHKSLQEWSESILRWLEGQRPPPNQGKAFNYGELMSQYFPGSNIDAWFNANGVPEGMKDYWWDYSLAKARTVGSTTTLGNRFTIGPINTTVGTTGGNQAWERLQSVSAQTRGQFDLGAQLAGTYSNKEVANRWMNEIMAQVNNQILPRQMTAGSGGLAALQFMPDMMEELLMGLLERGGSLGALIGGGLGYGIQGAQSLVGNLMGGGAGGLLAGLPSGILTTGGISGLMDQFAGGFSQGGGMSGILKQILDALGDEPDLGDSPAWGPTGGTSARGLHPDMTRKVNAMMRANPKLKVNSGLRDTVQQQMLKAKGHTQVSGKASAHTRGMAADLGPSSEYGWIVKNARKFGLKSGVGFGEPWHVGLGDAPTTVDTGGGGGDADTGSGLGALFGLLTGTSSKGDIISGISDLFPAIMQLFFGMFGMGQNAVDPKLLQFDPSLLNQLRSGSVTGGAGGLRSYQLGGSRAGTSFTYGASFGGNVGGGRNDLPDEPSDRTSSGATTLEGALKALGITNSGLSAGAMVAAIANKVGFRGEGLTKAVAIAERESNFRPDAYNGDASTGDKSYGLTQINMLGSLGPARLRQYGLSKNEDLFDPFTNMTVMYGMSGNGTNFYPWTGYRPGIQLSEERLGRSRAYIKEAGLGDLPDYAPDYYSMQTFKPSVSPTQVAFHNSFVIQSTGGSPANGGIDARRAATQIATHLEAEMKQRLSRNN